MIEYYDQKAKEPVFEVGQRVWIYTPRTRKRLSKKLMHHCWGPNRVVKKLSPVNFELRTVTNKKVEFSCHANRMKPFADLNLRPIGPPSLDDLAEPYIYESVFPKDCFEPISAEANPKDIDISPVGNETPLSLKHQKEKESNKETDREKTKNQLQNAKESPTEATVIDHETVFSAEKNDKTSKEKSKGCLSTWSSGSTILKANQRGNQNTIFWIDVSLKIMFYHKNNYSFCTLPCCLGCICLIFSYP